MATSGRARASPGTPRCAQWGDAGSANAREYGARIPDVAAIRANIARQRHRRRIAHLADFLDVNDEAVDGCALRQFEQLAEATLRAGGKGIEVDAGDDLGGMRLFVGNVAGKAGGQWGQAHDGNDEGAGKAQARIWHTAALCHT
jgi:hypothetical protein